MAGFEKLRSDLSDAGISVVAASVDDLEHARTVADEVGFPVAHGVTRADADRIGAWWDEKRGFVQPSEFILRGERVVNSTYSSGPVGRLDAQDALALVRFLESRRKGG